LSTPAVLALEDGSLFHGTAIGAAGTAAGEVVFNTAMTGYQEILTDPSYYGQLVTLTYPHIGNVGANAEDAESAGVKAAGLILRDSSMCVSNWRSEQSLGAYLRGQILYRLAEMLESRRDAMVAELRLGGATVAGAQKELSNAIALTIWYAGLCDKVQSLLGSQNSVQGPFFNFSTIEPTGVVAVVAPDKPALVGTLALALPLALASASASAMNGWVRKLMNAIMQLYSISEHLSYSSNLPFALAFGFALLCHCLCLWLRL
jgi:hypothetical protein